MTKVGKRRPAPGLVLPILLLMMRRARGGVQQPTTADKTKQTCEQAVALALVFCPGIDRQADGRGKETHAKAPRGRGRCCGGSSRQRRAPCAHHGTVTCSLPPLLFLFLPFSYYTPSSVRPKSPLVFLDHINCCCQRPFPWIHSCRSSKGAFGWRFK